MCLARSSMSLVTLTSWISSKYSSSDRTSYGYRSSVPIRPLSSGSSAMMCSRLVSTTRPIATLFIADGLPDHGEGVVPDLAVRTQVVGPDDVARVDLVPLHKLVDFAGAGGFQRDV